jgi:UDP-2,3-diacylglucosamine pyrophosphatase LpxH
MASGLRFGWQVIYRTENALFDKLSGNPRFRSLESQTYPNKISASNPVLYHPVELHPTNLLHLQLRKSLAQEFSLIVVEKNFPYRLPLELFGGEVSVNYSIGIFLPNVISLRISCNTPIEIDKRLIFKQRQFSNHHELRYIANYIAALIEDAGGQRSPASIPLETKTLITITTDSEDVEFIDKNAHFLAALLINDPDFEHSAPQIFDKAFRENRRHNQKHQKIRRVLINKQAFLSVAPRTSAASILINREIQKKQNLFELGAALRWFYQFYPSARRLNREALDYLFYATTFYIREPDLTFSLSYANTLAWKLIMRSFKLQPSCDASERLDPLGNMALRDFNDRHPNPSYIDPAFWAVLRSELSRQGPHADVALETLDLKPLNTLVEVTANHVSGGFGHRKGEPSRQVTWLHLSDLHLSPTRTDWDADRVLSTLQEDFRAMEEEHHLLPDFIFFTGDLAFGTVNNETISDQYKAVGAFLEQVRSSFSSKITKENIFLVPGNHDVDRARASVDQTYWLDQQRDLNVVRALMQRADVQWKRYMERLAPYKAFLEHEGFTHLLNDPDRLIYGIKREVNGTRIGIGGLNTVWSCCRNGEKGKLWMAGDFQVGYIRQRLKDTDLKIALLHHPINWLVENEDPSLGHNLRQEFQFVLHGHEHQVWVDPTNDGHTEVAAGACYDRSDKENGYNLVRLNVDEGVGEVWLRRYDRQGGGWIPRVVKGKTDNHGKWTLAHLNWLKSVRQAKTAE